MIYKLVFYVPETHLELVKTALFAAGAGHFEHYDQCSWQILGQGQFRPLKHANPHIGTPGQLESLPEYRVEMICSKTHLQSVLKALFDAHPYEEPAYEVWPLSYPRDKMEQVDHWNMAP